MRSNDVMPVRRRSIFRYLPNLVVAVALLYAFIGLTKPGRYLNLSLHRLQWVIFHSLNYQATINRITIATGLNDGPPQRVLITVRRGALVSAVDLFDRQPLSQPALYADPYVPLDKLFGLIQDALDRDADRLSISYDIWFGYPKYISIDYDRQIFDDEVTIQVEQFTLTR